ncbi:hypothetical protein [Arthrobacter sp. NPDC058192]|uniref:hypothetical protein n=1 Tax=Arthrobacter sp. NPDC058192 TaxID=3346372 RepID=UPI0036EBC02A
MTITEAPARTHNVQVRTDLSGKPLAIRHDGQIWLVDPTAESRHWQGLDAVQDSRGTAAVVAGDLVSSEYWRVQVRTDSTSACRVATLRRETLSTQWLLENISDAEEVTVD